MINSPKNPCEIEKPMQTQYKRHRYVLVSERRIWKWNAFTTSFPAFASHYECYDKRISCLHIPLAQEMNMSSDILAARVNMNQNEYKSIVFSCFSLKTNYLIKCLKLSTNSLIAGTRDLSSIYSLAGTHAW